MTKARCKSRSKARSAKAWYKGTELNRKKHINVARLKDEQFDIVLYTPTIDCGVDVTMPYDMVMLRAGTRSISAGAHYQMIHRCRNIADKRIIVVCDNYCTDFDKFPGYTSRPCSVAPTDTNLNKDSPLAPQLAELGSVEKSWCT